MLTIAQSGHSDQTIHKSRFIGIAECCTSEREVAHFLTKFASQHQHASHLAFAYQLKTSAGIVQRMNDAGEPSGTAGRPILQPIEGMKLVNVCVGVIRYYGGINLGTGGLARAYGSTARMALDAAKLIDFVQMSEISVAMAYADVDLFVRDVIKVNGKIVDKKFEQIVRIAALVPTKDADALLHRYQVNRNFNNGAQQK